MTKSTKAESSYQTATIPRAKVSRVRAGAFYACAALLALVVSADFVSHAMDFYAPHHIHVIAHEIVSGITIACALSQLIAPRRAIVAAQLLLVLFAVGWLYDALTLRFSGIGVIMLLGLAVAVLHPLRAEVFSFKGRPHLSLAIVAVISAAPVMVFSLAQAANQRADFEPQHALLGHWEWVAACAAILALCGLLAALGSRGFSFAAWCAGLGAIAFGLGSLVFAGEASSVGTLWSVAASTVGALFIGLSEWLARRIA